MNYPSLGSPSFDMKQLDKKQVAPHRFLVGAVMGVLWAIVTMALWAGLAVAFGRSKSNGRLLAMLVLGAVAVAILCAHSYREGWMSRHHLPR